MGIISGIVNWCNGVDKNGLCLIKGTNEKQFKYDEHNRMIYCKDNWNTETYWEYDENGNEISCIDIYSDGRHQETIHKYDSHGNLLYTKG